MDQDAIRYGGRPLVLDGDPAPPPTQKRSIAAPQSLAHVYCGQTAEWIKVKLGMEVGLGPGHIVLDDGAHAAPVPKGPKAPQLSAYVCCG